MSVPHDDCQNQAQYKLPQNYVKVNCCVVFLVFLLVHIVL